jgi:hypothetical protein
MKWLGIISGILLLLAIPTGWPYDFYVLLRWAICTFSIIIAYNFYKSNLTAWTFVFGAVAFLFNPIIPIYLNKGTWVTIDLISAILFFIATFSIKTIKQK